MVNDLSYMILECYRSPNVRTNCQYSNVQLNVYVFGVAPLVEARGKSGADESLLEEASRYSHSETCSFPSLLLLFVPGGGGEKEVVVADWDLVALKGPSYVNGEGSVDPLRVI